MTKSAKDATTFLEMLTLSSLKVSKPNKQCTVFWKAYILSGSGFHEFLYSIIESLKKTCEITEFIPNQLHFHKKKTLANFRDIIEKCKKTLF